MPTDQPQSLPPLDPPKQYVYLADNGVLRVGENGVLFESIAIAFFEGESPESIMESYPVATLEEIYGAITWLLANGPRVQSYMQHQEKVWEEFRARCDREPIEVVERLRKLKRERAAKSA